MAPWTLSKLPAQAGRRAIITGAGGLGFECALALARAGADVLIAGRNARKGAVAVDRIRATVPGAAVHFDVLDLADLRSIADFGGRRQAEGRGLDLLINNAGVMVPPLRQETADGFELQLGTNHLGHFALTATMLPLLRQAGGARVVSLSSIAARNGVIYFDDLQARAHYRPMRAYSQSKLACLMFAFELQRRSEAGGWGVSSIAAHPGIARTDLLHNGPGRWSAAGLSRSLLWFLFQPAAQGALPALYAAAAPEARPGGYYGPNGLGEARGYPTTAAIPAQARDGAVAARLWQVSETLTGHRFG